MQRLLTAGKLLAIVLPFLALSCAAPEITSEDPKQGAGFFFRPGYPEMRLTAIGLYDLDGNPGVDVIADIVYGSLVFNKRSNQFQADLILEVRLIQEDVPVPKAYSQSFEFNVSDQKSSITSSQESFQVRRRIPVEPGKYRVYVGVIDASSKKDTRLETTAEIPDPEAPDTYLTDILIDIHDVKSGEWISVPTYDLRGDMDSVRFTMQLSKNDFKRNLILKTRLLRFQSDSLPSRPLSGISPSSMLATQGILFDKTDTVGATRRSLGQTVGNITFVFPYRKLDAGNYRFEVELSGDQEKAESRARDFGVKTTWYPTLRTVKELAEPLIYLMTEREYRKMMRIQDVDSLKAHIDSYWLRNIQNPTIAKNVISLFYSRVEEANKRFSCYKEGWKTDMGQLFILFGAPWQVETPIQQHVWHYGYNRTDRSLTFVFDELRPTGKQRHGFKTYMLQRRSYYTQLYNLKIQDWLDGTVLTREM
jgi:GWxTD domain-containing protein